MRAQPINAGYTLIHSCIYNERLIRTLKIFFFLSTSPISSLVGGLLLGLLCGLCSIGLRLLCHLCHLLLWWRSQQDAQLLIGKASLLPDFICILQHHQAAAAAGHEEIKQWVTINIVLCANGTTLKASGDARTTAVEAAAGQAVVAKGVSSHTELGHTANTGSPAGHRAAVFAVAVAAEGTMLPATLGDGVKGCTTVLKERSHCCCRVWWSWESRGK